MVVCAAQPELVVVRDRRRISRIVRPDVVADPETRRRQSGVLDHVEAMAEVADVVELPLAARTKRRRPNHLGQPALEVGAVDGAVNHVPARRGVLHPGRVAVAKVSRRVQLDHEPVLPGHGGGREPPGLTAAGVEVHMPVELSGEVDVARPVDGDGVPFG